MEQISKESIIQVGQDQKYSFIRCKLHDYEEVCCLNIKALDIDNSRENEELEEDDDDNEQLSQFSDIGSQIDNIDRKKQNEDKSNRYMCAECLCEKQWNKKHIIPLRKLILNEKRLYNNWPPLLGNLNSKIYSILTQPEQHNCMSEIEKTCNQLIDSFVQLVNQLKKDLTRIECDRISTLQDLENLYQEISSFDQFKDIVQHSAGLNSNKQDNKNNVEDNTNEANKMNEIRDKIKQLKENVLAVNQSDENIYQQGQQKLNIRQNNDAFSDEDINCEENSKQNKASGSMSLNDFLLKKENMKISNSQHIRQIVEQLGKYKPLSEQLEKLQEMGKQVSSQLTEFASELNEKKENLSFEMVQSSFKLSRMLQVARRDSRNHLKVTTQGQVWGQVYSDFILDCKRHYTFHFHFDNEVQNFIIVGLILDLFKDSLSQGSSQNHFGKIFGQENSTYCGRMLKGTQQLSFPKREDVIVMEVCIAQNKLTFSDLAKNHVSTLHRDYQLDPTAKYRLCVEFYDFETPNTFTIVQSYYT